MGEVECSQRCDDMEWVITIVPRGQMFTKCSQRVSIIFLPYAFYNTFTLPFTICFARRLFTMVFTIFLAERFYNIFTLFSFYKYLFHFNSSLSHHVPRSLFILFTMFPTRNPLERRDIYIYTGEDWGSGFTFIYSLRFLILFLSLTAGNWDYLY